uniref:Reverse transcriptase domain-containing protein n=1 Tax=Tanacetum cinerariifolium TaxID=118510 RepID=A0A6L2KCC4_TANCI|nr:reverse transcriptase domain-containing protein [Tanacetum cinerariifolium]
MSAVRDMLGKEQDPQGLGRPASDTALREYCDRNYHQLLPIIAEKVHQENVQQERLKDLKKRLGSRHARGMSESPEPRRERSKSPRKKDSERRTVFKRLEKGVFHRLGDKRKNKGKFKPPPPMTTPVEKRNASKFCEFHREVGHTTDECMHLKRQIEEMLKVGKLSHLIKELKESNGKDHAKIAKKEETSRKEKPLAILMVQPWQRVAKQRITQTFSPGSVISFSPLGDEDGTEGPMIIKAKMGGHFVHRMYVDGGSSSEILYEHCFNRFRPNGRSQMVPATTPLIGFSGEIIWPLRQIPLLVKTGDKEHSTSARMNFMVVRSPSPYNGIIVRPGVRRIQAVLSTTYRMLKFPVAGVPQAIINQVTEEKIQVAIYPEYLKQTIAIGSTLTEEERKELPQVKYPRRMSTRQTKEMGQAPERNKAIYEEVEKLVDAGIMKEVHYHTWLSNPVMVKKHDGGWRMYVDFKDLNKTCPKYDYPLPEIDWKQEVIRDIEKTFKTLREINMKLIPKKCTFGMREGTFLGYKVNADGLKVCPNKVEAVLSLPSPKCLKDVQKDTPMEDEEALSDPWILFTDRSSCIDGSRVGLIITNPEGMEFTYTRRFRFDATNNKAEYEALIASLRISEQMGIKNLQTNVDSRLVANQVNQTYIAKEPGMIKYLEKVKALTSTFKEFSTKQVPIVENKKADALRKITSTSFAHLSKKLLAAELKEKSIDEKEVLAVVEEEGRTWMTPIHEYLTKDILPEEKRKARAICHKAEDIKQFRDNPFKDWCENLCVRQCFASVKHPQANGMVERENSSLGEGIKARNEETPFSLTYGMEAVIPVEIGMTTLRTAEVDMIKSDEALEINLDLLEEKTKQATIQEAKSKAMMDKYYNARVRSTSFKPGDLVYRSNEASHAEDEGKLRPKWEGPYKVTEALRKGAYKLRDRSGNILLQT